MMIIHKINQLAAILEALKNDEATQNTIEQAVAQIVNCYKHGGKVIFCGNGGSSAQAQHLAAELSGRFYFDRPPIPAEACHVNPSFMTAVSNDYDFTKTYSRYVESAGRKGDVLIGLSTSGNSKNIIQAFMAAQQKEISCIALTGADGGELKKHAALTIKAPSDDVPRVQETHLLLGHYICEMVEKILFGENN